MSLPRYMRWEGKVNMAAFNSVEYPTNNPTEGENERNYLATQLTQAYLAYKRGELSQEDYEMISEGIHKQGDFSISLEG